MDNNLKQQAIAKITDFINKIDEALIKLYTKKIGVDIVSLFYLRKKTSLLMEFHIYKV